MSERGALLPKANIPVIGAPYGFDLEKAIVSATSIWIITAFARFSGWRLIRSALLKSNSKVTLIAGLDFCHSEPRVLRDWIGREFTKRSAKAFTYSEVGATFHPKVFLIESPKETFALVGSGNLSAGGLSSNVECFAYVRKPIDVSKVRAWIAGLLDDRLSCVPLSADDIKEYAKRYKRGAKAKREANKQAATVVKAIRKRRQPAMALWARAIADAKRFFETAEFRRRYLERRRAARQIKRVLRYPSFTFSRAQWSAFYSIPELGRLVPIYKYYLYDRRNARLRSALRQLGSARAPIAERVDRATDIWGSGINLVSKILAAIDPHRFPVWNDPVRAALTSFGYPVPHGGTIGSKYAAYVEAMMDFRNRTAAPDMLLIPA